MNRRPPKNISAPPQNRKSQRRAASATLNATPDGQPAAPSSHSKRVEESQSLPVGWTRTTLGEVIPQPRPKVKPQDFSSLQYIGMEHIEAHTARSLGSVPATAMKSAAGHFWPGDVLYGRLRPYLNKVYCTETEGLCSSEFIVLPKGENHDPKFLLYRLNSVDFVSFASSLNAGDRPRVDFEEISGFPIFLPPLPEQRRIVAEIEKQFTRLEAGVGALRRVQANLKRYRAAVLKAACEGRLVGNKPVPESVDSNYGPSSALPHGWRWTTPVEICERIVDCHNKTAPYSDTGIPLVRTTNIRNGRIDCGDTRFVNKPTYAFWSRRCLPKPGDILFTREAPMGETGIIPDEVTLCMGQRMMLMRCSPKILNRYLLTALQTPDLKSYIVRNAFGSGVRHLRVKDVENLPIPLPPLAEQKRIVSEVERRLSVVEELSALVTANLQRATRLRQAMYGIELVDSVARLCCMNLLLHGIGGESGNGGSPLDDTKQSRDGSATIDEIPIQVRDALAGKHGEYDIVLANPPFGKKSSVTIVNDAGDQQKESLVINRDDFWASTSNKQLNFLQHIFTILKQHGHAAVVLPDNVLFEGGAGETIRRELLKQADVHTLLRLPTGIFYAQGVKANVLFFDRKPAQEKPWTDKLWIYDLRTNKHFTLKESTLQRADLDDFVACYFGNVDSAGRACSPSTPQSEKKGTDGPAVRPYQNRMNRKETERFKAFTYEELLKRDKVNLDIFWLKDDSLEDSANLPPPGDIAKEITEDLEAALEQFAEIAEDLPAGQ